MYDGKIEPTPRESRKGGGTARTAALVLLALLLAPAASVPAASEHVALHLQNPPGSATRGTEVALAVVVRIDDGWHINAREPNRPYLIPTELTLTATSNATAGPVRYPQPVHKHLGFAGSEELLLYEGTVELAAPLQIPADFAGDRLRIAAALRYQACNDTTCLRPITVRSEIALPLVTGATQPTVQRTKTRDTTRDRTRLEGWLQERGLLFTLLAIIVLGLGLNLTPCVYPLISVTIAYFGGQARRRRGIAGLALVYVLGIALSFSVLGVAAALSGGLFGSALQQPAVILAIAAVLVALALSNFGLYQLRPPAALMKWSGRSGGGVLGAFFMGLTMGIVAAPCVGPIVIGLLMLVGSRQDPILGFFLFFFLALGMGSPYIVLAVAAGSIRQLPRSGEWLVWTERLFGCVLLSLAAYFVAPILPEPLHSWLLPLAIATSGIYLGVIERAGNAIRFFPLLKKTAGAVLVGSALWIGLPRTTDTPIHWEPITALFADGRQAADRRPLLIDFVAEWCIPCREMDHTTYRDPGLVREADRFRMVRADITQESELNSEIVEKYRVNGVPTLILFSSSGEERKRFAGYTGPDELLEVMRQVR